MDLIQLLFVLFSGLVFGSFVTLASYRLPRGEDIVFRPSRCPVCDTNLTFKDLFPVFSWIISRGKCRYCGNKIESRYPLIELATAVVFLLLYARYGLTLQSIILALMAVALLIMIVADLEHYIIPDQIHLFLLPLALVYHFTIHTPWENVAGGFAAGLALGLVLHYGYRWLRKKDGLGFGDVKFFAVAGAWLTLLPFVPFLFLSGVFGVVFGLLWRALGKGKIFPFGPALAVALFICIVFPEITNLFWNIGEFIR